MAKKLDTLTTNFAGNLSYKRKKKGRFSQLVTGIVTNPILVDDIITCSLKGIDISNKSLFIGEPDENYEIFCFSKSGLAFPNQEIFENLLSEKDINTLKSLKVKDFFSFEATVCLSNFDGKLHKINNVKKIEDAEQIKKIKTLLKQSKKRVEIKNV